MRDLTDRALATAAVRGAEYADVRIVRRRDESIAVKTGRVEGVASGESEGFGIRVLVDGAWGFASSSRARDRRGRPGRRPGRADRPGERDRPPRPGPPRRPAAGPRARTRRRWPRTRSRSRSRRRSPTCWRRTAIAAGVTGRRLHRVDLRRPARVEDVRRQRRQLHRADDHPRRRRASRRTRSRATSTSAEAIPTPAAAGRRPATSTSAGSASPSTPGRSPRRPSSC